MAQFTRISRRRLLTYTCLDLCGQAPTTDSSVCLDFASARTCLDLPRLAWPIPSSQYPQVPGFIILEVKRSSTYVEHMSNFRGWKKKSGSNRGVWAGVTRGAEARAGSLIQRFQDSEDSGSEHRLPDNMFYYTTYGTMHCLLRQNFLY